MKAAIRAELDRLKQKDGRLMAQAVVDAARPRDSILHDEFTWDRDEALEKNLLSEARELIANYTVVVHVGDRTTRTRHFVSLSSDRKIGGGYRPIEIVMSDAEMRQQLLDDAINALAAVQARYQHLVELAEVFSALETVKSRKRKAA